MKGRVLILKLSENIYLEKTENPTISCLLLGIFLLVCVCLFVFNKWGLICSWRHDLSDVWDTQTLSIFSFCILSFHFHACYFMVKDGCCTSRQKVGKGQWTKGIPVESACFYQENRSFPGSSSLKSGILCFIGYYLQCIYLTSLLKFSSNYIQ